MVNTLHPKLEKYFEKSKLCTDFFIGYDNVVNSTYVRQWKNEERADYNVRLSNTSFANVISPIVQSTASMVLSGGVEVNGSTEHKDPYAELSNIDGYGSSLSEFTHSSCVKAIVDGIHFVGVTSLDGKQKFISYNYTDLVNFRFTGNKLSQIVFKETVNVNDGEFGTKIQNRYVVYTVGGGAVWYSTEADGELTEHDKWTNGLDYIPITWIVNGKSDRIFECTSMMYDLCKLSRNILNLESQLANILSLIANPVLLIFGEAGSTIALKSNEALKFANKVEFGAEILEFKGTGSDKISQQIERLEKKLDTLSFNLLNSSESNTRIEASESRIKNMSFLSATGQSLEDSLTFLSYAMCELRGTGVPFTVKIMDNMLKSQFKQGSPEKATIKLKE